MHVGVGGMCVCVCEYIYIYMYVCEYVCDCMCAYDGRVYMYAYVCICMCVCRCARVFESVGVCVGKGMVWICVWMVYEGVRMCICVVRLLRGDMDMCV